MIHPGIDPAREAMVRRIDGVPDRPAKRCSHCRHAKPLDEFPKQADAHDGLSCWCRDCKRIDVYVRYHERGGREKKAAYEAREEVKVRRVQTKLAYRDRRRDNDLAYMATPRGKLVHERAVAAVRLRDAYGARWDRLQARIAALNIEIARLDGNGPGRAT